MSKPARKTKSSDYTFGTVIRRRKEKINKIFRFLIFFIFSIYFYSFIFSLIFFFMSVLLTRISQSINNVMAFIISSICTFQRNEIPFSADKNGMDGKKCDYEQNENGLWILIFSTMNVHYKRPGKNIAWQFTAICIIWYFIMAHHFLWM